MMHAEMMYVNQMNVASGMMNAKMLYVREYKIVKPFIHKKAFKLHKNDQKV